MVVPVRSSMAGVGMIVPTGSMSGLGDQWCQDPSYCVGPIYDDSDPPNQVGCDSCSTPGSTTTTPTPGSVIASSPTLTQPDGTPWPFAPGTSSSVSATGSYMSAGGNIITTYSDGSYTMVSPSTGAMTKGTGSPPSASQGTVTSAQASAWPSIVASLAAAGVKLGTVAMLQPGQTLLPNGTILGSGQSLIGGNITSSNQQFAAILTNPMFLVAAGGVLLLALLESR